MIYPLAVWQETLSRVARVPSASRAKAKFLERANYYGQVSTIDAQGRLLVPGVLREVAGIKEDVVVLGSNDHLIVWNEERMEKRLVESPMTDEDYKELELHGV
jgi:MraZ protein